MLSFEAVEHWSFWTSSGLGQQANLVKSLCVGASPGRGVIWRKGILAVHRLQWFSILECVKTALRICLCLLFPLDERRQARLQNVINNQTGCGSFKKWLRRYQKSEVNIK